MRQECEKPLVSMAMGSIGSITRISGENFGSGITFGTGWRRICTGTVSDWRTEKSSGCFT